MKKEELLNLKVGEWIQQTCNVADPNKPLMAMERAELDSAFENLTSWQASGKTPEGFPIVHSMLNDCIEPTMYFTVDGDEVEDEHQLSSLPVVLSGCGTEFAVSFDGWIEDMKDDLVRDHGKEEWERMLRENPVLSRISLIHTRVAQNPEAWKVV